MRHLAGWWWCGLALLASGCLCGDGGQVCLVAVANSSLDQYTQNPSADQQTWMQQHYARMLVYAPYFDARLAWYPNGWAYKDLYAIYVGGTVAQQHPEWILRDSSGNLLYIPYACAGGSCPQYAADIGNSDFRAFWIGEATTTMAAGYKGLFEDDCNMRMEVGDGNGHLVVPYDPRLRRLMTDDDWRGYMADFTEAIRQAVPQAELVQNQVYFMAPNGDPNVSRAQSAANYIWVERGFNDTGITGGQGQFGFETLLSWIDIAHSNGAGVVEEPGSASWGQEYALACYFLTSTGADGLSSRNGGLPNSWWSGYDVDLGRAKGWPLGRYTWNGLLRRDFARGFVLVNEPGSPTVTVSLGGTYQRLDGSLVSSVTIGPADGVALRAPSTSATVTSPPALGAEVLRVSGRRRLRQEGALVVEFPI